MLLQETLHKRCFLALRRQTKKKISPDPKNLPIAQPVHQSQIFQWLNVRTQKYFQYAENSRITSPPHLSAEISFAQQNYAPNYLGPNLVAQNIQNISMPRNAKNMKLVLVPKPEITPIIERGAALSMSYLHQISLIMGYISCTKYFSNYRSPKYVEPKNDAGVGNISHQNEVV